MPDTFGKYELLQKIAQGGMAEIFLARRSGDLGGFAKKVAIKRIFRHLTSQEEVVNMFFDEARIAATLHHPNIVQIYDLGEEQEHFYIAMEYVHGADLRRVCKRGLDVGDYLPMELAARVVADAAAGLHYAHTRTDSQGRPMNIVHRDISPQNLLVSMDGHVKICDFGIAKGENRLARTRSGQFKGKLSYMSPEQFNDESVDARADIFNLGIVLYEVTLARRLFSADTDYERMRQVANAQVTPPSEVRPDFPLGLERIIMRALRTDPDERYETAEQMQLELEDWLHERNARVGPVQIGDHMEELFPELVGGIPHDMERVNFPSKGREESEARGDRPAYDVMNESEFEDADDTDQSEGDEHTPTRSAEEGASSANDRQSSGASSGGDGEGGGAAISINRSASRGRGGDGGDEKERGDSGTDGDEFDENTQPISVNPENQPDRDRGESDQSEDSTQPMSESSGAESEEGAGGGASKTDPGLDVDDDLLGQPSLGGSVDDSDMIPEEMRAAAREKKSDQQENSAPTPDRTGDDAGSPTDGSEASGRQDAGGAEGGDPEEEERAPEAGARAESGGTNRPSAAGRREPQESGAREPQPREPSTADQSKGHDPRPSQSGQKQPRERAAQSEPAERPPSGGHAAPPEGHKKNSPPASAAAGEQGTSGGSRRSQADAESRSPESRQQEAPRAREKPGDRGAVGERDVDGPSGDSWDAGLEEDELRAENRRSKFLAVGGFLLAVGVLVGFGYLVTRHGTAEDENLKDNQPQAVAPGAAADGYDQSYVESKVTSEPAEARVVVNGRWIEGKTPMSAKFVDGRTNEVHIYKKDHHPAHFTVEGGEEMEVPTAELEPVEDDADTAKVEIESDPEGARVWLDGRDVGEAPLTIEGVSRRGTHHVHLEKDGYHPFDGLFDVLDGETTPVPAELVRRAEGAESDRCQVKFDVVPKRTMIHRGGEIAGTSPVTKIFRCGRLLAVNMEKSNYEDGQRHVYAGQDGGTLWLGTRLEKIVRARGSLDLEVPENIKVYVGNNGYGSGSIEDIELPEGEHEVVFETPKRKRYTKNLRVHPGKTTKYRLEISGEEATLQRVEK